MLKPSTSIQRWGNSLAVRIPAAVSKKARLKQGQPVAVSVQGTEIVVTSIGEPNLSLAQKLAAFDPIRHSGEAMITTRVGKEAM
jgi:antitoxin MazE